MHQQARRDWFIANSFRTEALVDTASGSVA
jgi:hypothetical protein